MKTVIVNPTKEQAKELEIIYPIKMLKALVSKVLRQPEEGYQPTIITPGHVGLFVANVEPKVVAANLYAGKNPQTFKDAVNAFDQFGGQIYSIYDAEGRKQPNPFWSVKLVAVEIFADKDQDKSFGIYVENPDMLKSLVAELDFAKVQINK